MTASTPDAAHDPLEVGASLPDAVRSAILERLLDDLRTDGPAGPQRSRYTKSDSGLYGKYEKYDALDPGLVTEIVAALEGIADRIATGADNPPGPAGRADT